MLRVLSGRGKTQLACYLAFLAASGCRKSETIQMKVDFFNEEHEVYNGNMYLTDKIRTKGRGKTGKVIQRYCIKSIFKPYYDAWMEERAEKNIDSPYLFVVKHGDSWEPATIATLNSFAETLSNMFHMDFYNHAMRHYFVTYLKSQVKLDQETIVSIVHWQSAAMVDIYDDTPKEAGLEDVLGKKGLFK
jgi:integrase